jgi:hypothetical protein
MKNIYLLVILSLGFSAYSQTYLISDTLIGTRTKQELQDEGFFFARYGVNIFRLTYNTTNPDGSPTIASGAVVLPWTSGCQMPLAVYCHGTLAQKDNAPSFNPDGEIIIGQALASDGYLAILPDYLGLGVGPGQHPYMHAASEASATIDMMRATREFCAANGFLLNGEVFITGYSQGGHAAAATAREIQFNLSNEFNVVAWTGGSGPYDVSGVQEAVIRDSASYPDPGYLPYIAVSYQHVYGNLYDSLQEAFIPPYDSIVEEKFQGFDEIAQINNLLPRIPRNMLQPSYFQDYVNDTAHPMRLALEDNDVYAWAPNVPVELYYCPNDSNVTFLNALVAQDSMTARGAASVVAKNVDPVVAHVDCAFPALLTAKYFFDDYSDRCFTTSEGQVTWVRHFNIYPNPTDGEVYLPLQDWQETIVRIYDLSGHLMLETTIDGGDERALQLDLPAGMFLVDLESKDKQTTQRIMMN